MRLRDFPLQRPAGESWGGGGFDTADLQEARGLLDELPEESSWHSSCFFPLSSFGAARVFRCTGIPSRTGIPHRRTGVTSFREKWPSPLGEGHQHHHKAYSEKEPDVFSRGRSKRSENRSKTIPPRIRHSVLVVPVKRPADHEHRQSQKIGAVWG